MEPHHHEHNHRVTSLNKAFIIGIVLNISFVIVRSWFLLRFSGIAL